MLWSHNSKDVLGKLCPSYTLRGFSKCKQVEVLEKPGEYDITAEIQFGQLRTVVDRINGVEMMPVATHRQFLGKLGISQRERTMDLSVIHAGEDRVDEKIERWQAEHDMLMGRMGERF